MLLIGLCCAATVRTTRPAPPGGPPCWAVTAWGWTSSADAIGIAAASTRTAAMERRTGLFAVARRRSGGNLRYLRTRARKQRQVFPRTCEYAADSTNQEITRC